MIKQSMIYQDKLIFQKITFSAAFANHSTINLFPVILPWLVLLPNVAQPLHAAG